MTGLRVRLVNQRVPKEASLELSLGRRARLLIERIDCFASISGQSIARLESFGRGNGAGSDLRTFVR